MGWVFNISQIMINTMANGLMDKNMVMEFLSLSMVNPMTENGKMAKEVDTGLMFGKMVKLIRGNGEMIK